MCPCWLVDLSSCLLNHSSMVVCAGLCTTTPQWIISVITENHCDIQLCPSTTFISVYKYFCLALLDSVVKINIKVEREKRRHTAKGFGSDSNLCPCDIWSTAHPVRGGFKAQGSKGCFNDLDAVTSSLCQQVNFTLCYIHLLTLKK